MEELVVKTIKTCSCQTQDTLRFVREGNEFMVYVNNVLLYSDLQKIKNFVISTKSLLSPQDYQRVVEFIGGV